MQRSDRHQGLLHRTFFGRGHMAPEQIMRGTETSCHMRASPLKKVTASWQLSHDMCIVDDSALYLCTGSRDIFFYARHRECYLSSMMR